MGDGRRHGAKVAVTVSAITTAMLPSCAVSGQEVRVSGQLGATTHELLDSPEGLGLAVGFQLSRRVGLRVGYERHRDRFSSRGSTCVGLVLPGQDCEGETLSNRAHVHAARVSVPVVMAEGERVTFLLVPGVRDAWVDSRQEGARTGRTRSAEEDMYGLELGGEVRVRLWANTPLHVSIGGVLAMMLPWSRDIVEDGYTPFNEGVALAGLELALSAVWR